MARSTFEILLLPAKVRYWIREIKRSPDTMKAAAILVVVLLEERQKRRKTKTI